MTESEIKKEKLLEQNGWTVECFSPFEIRHKDGSRATGFAAQIVADSLVEDGGALQVYQDAYQPAPPTAGWPMNKALYEDFVDSGTLVTFTALVPLDLLVQGDIDALVAYCQQAFGEDAEISNSEFRVVPNESEIEGWDERFTGDVALQVSCVLTAVD